MQEKYKQFKKMVSNTRSEQNCDRAQHLSNNFLKHVLYVTQPKD